MGSAGGRGIERSPRSTGVRPATWLGGHAASDNHPGPLATVCPERAVSIWDRDSRDSRGGAAGAASLPCVQVVPVVRVASGGPAVGPRDFVPRSSALGRGSTAGGYAAATSRDLADPRTERRPRCRCRRRGPGAVGRQASCGPVRPPPPRPLRSCTAADSALSACACNRQKNRCSQTMNNENVSRQRNHGRGRGGGGESSRSKRRGPYVGFTKRHDLFWDPFPRDAFSIDESKAPVNNSTSRGFGPLRSRPFRDSRGGTRRVPADAGVCESSAVSRADSARRVWSRSRNTISGSSQGEFLKLDERRMLIFYFALISRPSPFISRPRRRPAPAVDTPD